MKKTLKKIGLLFDNNILILICFFTFFSFITILISCYSTSPLHKNSYGIDSPIFMSMGRGILNGAIPYRDLFDHKGPLIFYIDAFGWKLFGNTLGIFIIEVVFMIVDMLFIYNISRLLLGIRQSIVSLVIFNIAFIANIELGNRVEEYSLPFLIVPMYLLLKTILKSDDLTKEHPTVYSFMYGICFAVNILNRMNNAAIICGIFLTLTILFVKQKAFKSFLLQCVFIVLGIVVIFIPVISYFYFNNALSEFIYANYTFNFIAAFHGSEKTSSIIWNTVMMISSLFITLFFLTIFKLKTKIQTEMIIYYCSLSVPAAFSIWLGSNFLHYLIIYIPVLALSYNFSTYSLRKQIYRNKIIKFIVSVIMVSIFIFPYVPSFFNTTIMSAKVFVRQTILSLNIKQIHVSKDDDTVDKNIEKIMSYIPKDECGNIWCYNVKPEFYIRANILPCYKYFILQTTHSGFDKHIDTEIDEYLNTRPPKWIIFSNFDLPNTNPTLLNKLNSDYQLITDTNDVQMGHLYVYTLKN